jgi:hypothetical protein
MEFMILDKKQFKVDSLTLMAGAPIAVDEYGVIIHQPKIKDIALIGESRFFNSIYVFRLNKKTFLETITKNKITEEVIEITNLFYDKTEEEIMLFVLLNQIDLHEPVQQIFEIMFENLEKISFFENHIYLSFANGHEIVINSNNFYIIKDIINQIFFFEESSSEFNPAAGAAEFIVKKLEERRRKLNQANSEKQKENKDVIADYLSILAIGSNNFSMQDLLNMTIYQLFKLMKKYIKYEEYQMQIKALMAGAEDIELVDWMKEN